MVRACTPDDGRVVSNFIVHALRNDPITIYGDGRQTRSFCYVDDMIEGIFSLIDAEPDTVNLGNPTELTIRQLAEAVLRLTGSSSELIERPLPENDPRQRRPDCTLANEKLGWAPKIAIEEGLTRTTRYFRTFLVD